MRLGFGEQTPSDYARNKWVSNDPDWHTSVIWFKKTGRPPKEYEDYHYLTLVALVSETDAILEEIQEGKTVFSQSRKIGPPSNSKVVWSDVRKTGDKQVDKWEKQIAAGQIPDLSK